MTIRLVYGPPAAGKTTYAREHAHDGDLVIDLDEIRASVGNEETARKLRAVMEERAREYDGDVWIIRTLAKSDERAEFMERVGVDEAIPLAVAAEVAKERARERGDSDEKISAIDRWWDDYTPGEPGGEGAEMDPNEQQAGPSTEGAQGDPAPDVQQEMKAELTSAGVPADVPVAEMSIEHQAAYWKARSRANQRDAEAARKELARSSERKAPEAPPAQEREDPALRDVFEARLDAALATRPELADVPFAKHLDMSTFKGEDGRIDREAVSAFIGAFPEGATARKHAGTPEGWGNNAPFKGASGVDLGREIFKASRTNL